MVENKSLLNRLQLIEGQVRGIQKMIEENRYCIEIITQTSAIRNALASLEDKLLERHLSTCVMNQFESGQGEKAKDEILQVYKLKRK
jgi:DNA-binding FrmR family transcriptional regulator